MPVELRYQINFFFSSTTANTAADCYIYIYDQIYELYKFKVKNKIFWDFEIASSFKFLFPTFKIWLACSG